MIKVGDEIKIGEYICKVQSGNFMDISYEVYYLGTNILTNSTIFKQFNITLEDINHLSGLEELNLESPKSNFPFCKSLEHLNDVISYILTKPRTDKLNELGI